MINGERSQRSVSVFGYGRVLRLELDRVQWLCASSTLLEESRWLIPTYCRRRICTRVGRRDILASRRSRRLAFAHSLYYSNIFAISLLVTNPPSQLIVIRRQTDVQLQGWRQLRRKHLLSMFSHQFSPYLPCDPEAIICSSVHNQLLPSLTNTYSLSLAHSMALAMATQSYSAWRRSQPATVVPSDIR